METRQYEMEVGAFLRGSVKRAILSWHARNNLTPNITEAKNLFSSFYVVSLEATPFQHEKFGRFLKALFATLEQEDDK